jgi:two-component system LytT family response regulator
MVGAQLDDPITAIIVDDEPLARDCVRDALDRVHGVEVVAECPDGEAAVRAIRAHQPDLVFLDVQMPGLDAFDVIREVGPQSMPAVIFVTAFEIHALRAFEIHALDYILKPFDDERFHAALRHAREQIRLERGGEITRRLAALLQEKDGDRQTTPASAGEPAYATRLMVRTRDRIHFVRTEDIDWIEGKGNYVRVHAGDESNLLRTSLTALLDELDPTGFVRIHRSIIVNLDRIREVQPWVGGDYVAILRDGRQLKVSRTYRDQLLRPTI